MRRMNTRPTSCVYYCGLYSQLCVLLIRILPCKCYNSSDGLGHMSALKTCSRVLEDYYHNSISNTLQVHVYPYLLQEQTTLSSSSLSTSVSVLVPSCKLILIKCLHEHWRCSLSSISCCFLCCFFWFQPNQHSAIGLHIPVH